MFSCVIKIQKTDCAAIDYKKKEKRRELKNENNQTTVREVNRIKKKQKKSKSIIDMYLFIHKTVRFTFIKLKSYIWF